MAATLMGVDPATVDYLAEAGRFLGQADRERIDDAGEGVDGLVTPFAPAPTADTAGRSG